MDNKTDSNSYRDTIVVADNSTTLRLVVRKVLEKDYNIVEADNGNQVISLVNELVSVKERSDGWSGTTGGGKLAVLIIGFELSGGTGLEVVTKLRNKFSKHELPIVLNTSNNKRENIKKAISAGISDYIVKPFPAELLVAKIRKLVKHAPEHSIELTRQVSQIPIFKDVPEYQVAYAMINCATTIELDAGGVICNQGDNNFDLFVLMEGKCDVLYNERQISEIAPIESIGEMGFLENQTRSATVVASQPSKLIVFDKDKFDNFLNEERAISEIICKNVIHTLSYRIKRSNRLIEQLTKLSSAPVDL